MSKRRIKGRAEKYRAAGRMQEAPPGSRSGSFCRRKVRMKLKACWSLLTLLLLSAGCAVGPKYTRPDYPLPTAHRSDAALPTTAAAATPTILADVKWFDLFQDARLQELIRLALEANYDVRIAAKNVLAAQAFVSVEKAPLYPSLNGEVSGEQQFGTKSTFASVFAGGRVAWELDIWGRIRRQTEVARAQYMSQVAVQSGIAQTLVTAVASTYFQLLELDQELAVAKQSLSSRQGSARLVEARMKGGISNQLELDQATSLVASASATIADVERRREQAENFLNTLMGGNPATVGRTARLLDQKLVPQVPAGLPSSLLDRRPDIMLAEQQLVAANARVGVAKSLFFPSITLTGSGGYLHNELTDTLKFVGGGGALGGSLTTPLFNAGAIWNNYKASKALREAAILTYQKAVQTALEDVSNSLIGYQKAKEYRAHRETFAAILRDQLRLADMRYTGGVSSYLEVLDTERQALDAELAYAQAHLAELDSVINLYKSLGGGWER
jgi:outer membrane protein, multidrug efflux system